MKMLIAVHSCIKRDFLSQITAKKAHAWCMLKLQMYSSDGWSFTTFMGLQALTESCTLQ